MPTISAKHLLGRTGGIAYPSKRPSPEELQYPRSQGKSGTAWGQLSSAISRCNQFSPPVVTHSLSPTKNQHFLSVKGL